MQRMKWAVVWFSAPSRELMSSVNGVGAGCEQGVNGVGEVFEQGVKGGLVERVNVV